MSSRKLPLLVAIDSKHTMDVDDAVGIEKRPDGSWLVTIVIAHAARHIPLDSVQDQFAKRQGATVYRGERAIMPMLPPAISDGHGALKAGSKRQAMIITLNISTESEVSLRELSFASVAIDHHVPYEEVAPLSQDSESPVGESLRSLIALSQGLLAARRSRGALAMYDLNRLVYLDEEGRIKQSKSREDAIAHILVQELMVLSNASLAAWAVSHDVPLLYRNHQAKSAAPASAELLTSIQGWLAGSAYNEQTARDQLNMLLGTAEYAAGVLGHYALNLPAYAHCTSPLRRFADLANQRQFAAAVLGEPLPYSREQLTDIAEHLNVVLRERKEERSAGFKDTIVRRAATAMDRQQFSRLADHELSQVLKLAAEAGTYSDELVETVCMRIKDGTLSDKVFDRLLEAQAGTLPGPIRDAWGALLVAAPERSKHLLMHGIQTGMFADFKVEDVPATNGGFCMRASMVRVADGEFISAICTAARKRDAENGASARLVLLHFGHQAGSETKRLSTSGNSVVAVTNHKGALMEYSQKLRLPAPRFEVQSSGPANGASFTCNVSLPVNGTVYAASAAGARTRMAAEHEASRLLLEKLPKQSTKSSSNGKGGSDNPIGRLQERLQQSGEALPDYTFSDADGGFQCSVRVPWGKFEGTASTKQDAKTLAARSALAQS